ncbi:MAG: DUF2889 domain-containing protein [Pseudomonadota bacterium]
MISFQRTQIVGAEFIDQNIIRFSGIQEDHIYGMEISMDVNMEDGAILKIDGKMKRYTNFVCPEAVHAVQRAVGLSLREPGWDKNIMREIGRKGCEHLAEIMIECGRCLDLAIMSKNTAELLKLDQV